MTITQLKYIVAIDNYRNFAKAAENCFVTQPTLSMQVHKLEEELGIQIFDRSKQPAAPTEIGIKIIEQARKAISESERINDIVQREKNEVSGIFRIGVIPTIAPYLLPLFLENFLNKHDKLQLVIDEIQTEQIIDKLKKDELDAAILATPLYERSIVERPIYYEPFAAYISKGHKLFDKEKINSSELSLKNLWLLKEGHCFRDHVIQICKTYNEPDLKNSKPLSFEGGTLDTLKKLVENNFGMTLLPYLSLNELKDTDKYIYVREINDPVPKREISIVYRRTELKKHIIYLIEKEIIESVPSELLSKENSLIVG